jgi:hypothetical protein
VTPAVPPNASGRLVALREREILDPPAVQVHDDVVTRPAR